MTFESVGSIAVFIQDSFGNIPVGLSGANMVSIVDSNRQNVANFVGEVIGSNNISAEFEPPIVSYSKADTIDFINAQAGGGKDMLGELTVDDSTDAMSSNSWRSLGDSQLNNIGRRARFARSLS